MRKFWSIALFIAPLFAQSLQPPQALTVVSATAKQVQLKWTGGDSIATGYSVERKALGGDYSTAVNVTATSAIDNNIDPYTAYMYRVRGTLSSNRSDPSNEVTVGPPPYGYNTVVPTPSIVDPSNTGNFGTQTRMILDTNGDPALAYTWTDPNGDGNPSDSALYFVRWDRAHYQWTSPVMVAVICDVQRFTLTPVSIAQDAGNGMFAIAFEDESHSNPRISIALSSDGGQNWTVKLAASDDKGDQAFEYQRPTLAMGAGNVYISFYHDFDGIRYVTGKQSDDPSKWTNTLVPLPGGYTFYLRYASLALDSKGNPAIAYMVTGDSGDAEAFWRPDGPATVITGNGGIQNDFPDIRLDFFGTQPRVVFNGQLFNYYDDYDHLLWMLASPDNGSTWSTAVNIRSDGNRDLSGPIDIASGSSGQAAIVTENNGGNLDGVNCGDPKLALSGDLLNWTTCGPSPAGTPAFSGFSPTVRYAPNDTLYIGFQSASTPGDLPLGVLVWRQPPNWVFPPPAQP